MRNAERKESKDMCESIQGRGRVSSGIRASLGHGEQHQRGGTGFQNGMEEGWPENGEGLEDMTELPPGVVSEHRRGDDDFVFSDPSSPAGLFFSDLPLIPSELMPYWDTVDVIAEEVFLSDYVALRERLE